MSLSALGAGRFRCVCVYCGSSFGARTSYRRLAHALAKTLVAHDIALVFGGGRVGLMGEMAEAVLAGGGKVIGVIPEQLVRLEVAHLGLTELHIVDSMHERKAMMCELADAFIALPGGLGTLEELFEMATWSQLGLHSKPVGVLDVDGYYAALVAFLDHSVDEKFLLQEHRDLFLFDTDPDALLARMESFRPVPLPVDIRAVVQEMAVPGTQSSASPLSAGPDSS